MPEITVLMFGDIVGRPGREGVRASLPELRKTYHPDFVMANVENVAHGFGITKACIAELKELGVDLCTSGNHIWDRKEEAERILSEEDPFVLRPENYDAELPGTGVKMLERGMWQMLVINLQGQVFMPQQVNDPFQTLERVRANVNTSIPIVVDFHAEATSEKVALARAFDGRVSAMLGTHTHVPTSDARILRGGTALQCDVGMCGAYESVIGMDETNVLTRFRTGGTARLEPAAGPVVVNATYLTIDASSGRATNIRPIQKIFPEFSVTSKGGDHYE